ncbi:MAG TPA: DNA primase [Stellaceae bacterium]|nr:DNA primase [Stellaceae bacterium]
MAFPPGFLDELRSRVSLADLVGKRVRLARKGREYGGLCPFHNEKTPSFYVVEDKGFFHCFGCGAHGDAIGFVMRSENLDFIEAIERLAGIAGVQVPQQTAQEREKAQRQRTLLEALEAATKFYEERLWSAAGRAGREYLAGRGLDEETMRRFRLGWAGDDRNALRRALSPEFPLPLLMEAGLLHASDYGGEPYDYFRERVIFPIGDRAGRVIAFGGRALADQQPKYLNSPEHPLFEKGRVLYGLSAARVNSAKEAEAGGAGAIVTEGYMDVIALHRAGFNTAVAPLGTALTEAHLAELWRLAPEPVLCFDGDTAGQRAALRALNRALPLLKPGHSLRFVTLPGGEDPDSLIRNSGAAAVEGVLRVAKPLAEMLWQSELDAKSVTTPERRADLERRVMAQAGLIADRTVQAEYRRFLRDKLFSLGRLTFPGAKFQSGKFAGRSRQGTRLPASPIAALRGGAPPPPPAPGRRQREILIGLLLDHPFLVAEAHEDIAALDFPEPELDRLRRAILEVEVLSPGLDAEALRQHLGQNGFAMTVDAVALALADHAGFLSRVSGADVVRQSWAHVTRMVRDDAEPVDDLTTPEAWDRFLALQGREAQEGFSEDDFPPGRAEGASPR